MSDLVINAEVVESHPDYLLVMVCGHRHHKIPATIAHITPTGTLKFGENYKVGQAVAITCCPKEPTKESGNRPHFVSWWTERMEDRFISKKEKVPDESCKVPDELCNVGINIPSPARINDPYKIKKALLFKLFFKKFMQAGIMSDMLSSLTRNNAVAEFMDGDETKDLVSKMQSEGYLQVTRKKAAKEAQYRIPTEKWNLLQAWAGNMCESALDRLRRPTRA
jgi:hypothetical protein